jgi:hypothetical protein
MSLRTFIVRIAATRVFRSAVFAGALIAALPHPARAQVFTPCPLIDARVTAVPSYEPGFLGHYKYTLTVAWDVGRRDPGHLDLLLELSECLCICDSRVVSFPAVAGTSTGVNAAGACTIPYVGAYKCKGDPSIRNEFAGAALKFVPDETLCSTDVVGSGTFVFYSPFAPGPSERQENAIAIKHGNSTCYGALVGQLPACDCTVPAESRTWGQLKFFYR